MNKVLKYILFVFTLLVSGLMSWVGYVYITGGYPGAYVDDFFDKDSILMWVSIGTFAITFISFVYHLYKDSRESGNPFFALRVFKYIFFFILLLFLITFIGLAIQDFDGEKEKILPFSVFILITLTTLFFLVLSIYKDSRKK